MGRDEMGRDIQHANPGLRCPLDALFPVAIQADLSAGGPVQATRSLRGSRSMRTRGQSHPGLWGKAVGRGAARLLCAGSAAERGPQR